MGPRAVVLAVLLTAPLAATASEPVDRRIDAEAVATAERAFSARAGVIGFRDAFIEYFTPDAIAFRPGPVLALGPLRRDPQPRATLEWRPAFVAVSGAGDMGLSTGPVIAHVPGREAVSHFVYTSVWETQPDGSWKVIIDAGIDTPAPAQPVADWVSPATMGARSAPLSAQDLAAARASLVEAELELAQASHDATDPASAFEGRLTADARLHRSGLQPVVGAAAVLSQLRASGPAKADWRPHGVRIAASGDFGTTWGSGSWTPRGDAAAAVATAYMHVWRKDAQGWRLLTDVTVEAGD